MQDARTLSEGRQRTGPRRRQDLRRHGESSCQRRAYPRGTKEDAQGDEIIFQSINVYLNS